MIRLKAKQQEKKAEDEKAAAADAETTATAAATTDDSATPAAEKPKTVKILGVGRGKRGGANKEKKRTPGEIRIQKGTSRGLGMTGRRRSSVLGSHTSVATDGRMVWRMRLQQTLRSSMAVKQRLCRSQK